MWYSLKPLLQFILHFFIAQRIINQVTPKQIHYTMELHKEEFHAQEASQTEEWYPKEQGRG